MLFYYLVYEIFLIGCVYVCVCYILQNCCYCFYSVFEYWLLIAFILFCCFPLSVRFQFRFLITGFDSHRRRRHRCRRRWVAWQRWLVFGPLRSFWEFVVLIVFSSSSCSCSSVKCDFFDVHFSFIPRVGCGMVCYCLLFSSLLLMRAATIHYRFCMTSFCVGHTNP